MSKSIVYSLKSIVLVLFSAILLSLSFSSLNIDFVAWFSFVPLFFALEGENKSQSFFTGFFCGFLFFALSMYWLVYVTPAGWLALSLYQALYFGAFGLIFSYCFTTYNLQLTTYNYFAIPSAWVLLEYLRANLAGGIGWNLLGYSQYKNLPIIQISDITGVWGVSFLVMLMNVAIYSTIKMAASCYRRNSKFRIKTKATFIQELLSYHIIFTFFILIIFSAALTYGYSALKIDKKKIECIKISVVQGNIPQKVKWDENYKKHIMDKYSFLTLEASKDKPQLIIWPETAVPGFLNYDKELMDWLTALIKRIKIPLLAGAPMLSEKNRQKDYNSAVLFLDKGNILARYDKLRLVLFGEFIPLEEKFPFLRKLFPITGNFISGKEYTVFRLQTTDYRVQNFGFSVLICFEDIFPNLVRQFVKRGADFMVNITNDAWFGESAAAYQHAAASVFRAVENRRAFIRSANTGLSCFIDKTGRIYEKVCKNSENLFIEGIKTAYTEIDRGNTTIYTKYGDVFILGCIILIIITFIGKSL